MSHFVVAVFTKDDDTEKIAKIMRNYQEGNEDEISKELLAFQDESEEVLEGWEGTEERVMCPDGSMISPYDDRFTKHWDDEYTGRVPEEIDGEKYRIVYVKTNTLYKDIEEYAKEYHRYSCIEEDGQMKFGYWYNPNAKWDWYEIGGRWNNMLRLKDGTFANSAKIKDINFEPTEKAIQEQTRFWELYIEKGLDNLTQEEKDELGFVFYTPKYYLETYKTKENYVRLITGFSTYAVIENDGEWLEKGEMGWFAISSATAEEEAQWNESFYDRFIKDRDPEEYITILDCHI